MNTKKIIFIGGAPWTWKTRLAKNISDSKWIFYISCDLIRNWMKSITTKDKYENLFKFYWTAEEHYKKYSVDETIKMEEKRDWDVLEWVMNFIKLNKDWKSYVIEWITIQPIFVEKIKNKFENIKMDFIFLIDQDKDRIREIIYDRWLWWKEKWVKELEIEYLIKTNKKYLEELKKNNYNYYIIDKDRNKTISQIKKDFKI